jgi:hypothetical protein
MRSQHRCFIQINIYANIHFISNKGKMLILIKNLLLFWVCFVSIRYGISTATVTSGGASGGGGWEVSPSVFWWQLSLISGESTTKIFSDFGRKYLKVSPIFGRKILLHLSLMLETVSDQFSSILKIVSGEFSSFFEGSFCNMSFPTFRKVSKSSNAFNESHNDPIGQ